MWRSTDGGTAWEESLKEGELSPIYTPDDALLTNRDAAGPIIARSTDDGATWTLIDTVPSLGFGYFPETFAALPPDPSLSGEAATEGVIVGGGNDGLIASTDDGFTWQTTDLFEAFRYRTISVIRAPWGVLYTLINDFERSEARGNGLVYESADGFMWTEVGQVPNISNGGGELVAAQDGSGDYLFAIDEGTRENLRVYASADRGRHWVATDSIDAESYTGFSGRLEQLVIGPHGRLWVAMAGPVGPSGVGGVLRTVEPVVAVASEVAIPLPDRAALEMAAPYPNPAGDTVTVTLTLPAPDAVSVTVYDMLGREVVLLHNGLLAAGEHRLSLATESLPPGTYVAHAVSKVASASQRFTIAR
ncbi:MAG: T9SS type A sorting domain-containing protein [Bacteroidota bacterium]